MHTKIERTWWFQALTGALAALATLHLMAAAGIVTPYHLATWVLYGVCFFGLQRAIAFAGWLIVLCLPPSLNAIEPER